MKTLVTGAAGFIGSHLITRLLAEGHDVVGIDSFTDYYDRDLKLANIAVNSGDDRFNFVHGDLNVVDLPGLLNDVSVIYHQAGQPGVRKSWGADFGQYMTANISATQHLLEACRDANIVRFVYASSSSVYGDAESYPTSEEARPQPRSPYGVTKLAAEHLCGLYASNFGLPTVSLRYFTVFGPRQRPDMAFTRFCRAAAGDSEIELYGSGDQVRDFTFVEDIVRANILAGASDCAPGTVLNVSGGTNATVNEVLEILGDRVGRPLKINRHPSVPGDVLRTGGDSARIRDVLGWTPEVSLREGLDRQFRWAETAV